MAPHITQLVEVAIVNVTTVITVLTVRTIFVAMSNVEVSNLLSMHFAVTKASSANVRNNAQMYKLILDIPHV